MSNRFTRWWHRQGSIPKTVEVDGRGIFVIYGGNVYDPPRGNRYRPTGRSGFVSGDTVRTESGPKDRIFVWHQTMEHAELWQREATA